MQIIEFTIRLIIILLPGGLASLVVELLTIQKKWSPFRFILYSVFLGVITYLTQQVFYYFKSFAITVVSSLHTINPVNFSSAWSNYRPENIKLWGALFNINTTIDPTDVAVSCMWGAIVGLLVSWINQHKLFFRFAKFLKLSKKYGDESLYTFFLNAKEVEWVWVRDKKKGFTYQGAVESFSETERTREIALRDVTVYTYDNSEFCYDIPRCYLSFQTNDVVIEIPETLKKEEEYDKGTKNRTSLETYERLVEKFEAKEGT